MSDSALVPRLDYIIWVQSSSVKVDHLVVPGKLIRQDIFSRGHAEYCIVGPELPNVRASGPVV